MTRKIKLLFVIDNSCYGGGEKTFSLLIRNLPADRFELFCASLPRGRFHEETKGHCRFLPLDLSDRFDLGNIGRLKRMMADNAIDIAHSQGARADFYCAFAAAKAGARAVSTVAMPVEGFEVGFLRKRLYLALNSFSEKKIAAFVTVSGFLKEFLVSKHGILQGRVTVIANPAALDGGPGFDAAKVIRELDLRGRVVLAALGRLERQKGFDILLHALSILGRERPGVLEKIKCVIAGAGSLEKELRQLAGSLGLGGKVVFPGFRSDIRDFLAASDIFLLPSRAEGQPLVLLEAMSMGKPVIAADLPGVKEIVEDGVNGALFRSGSPAALAEKIAALVSAPGKSAALGIKASETAARFTVEEFVGRHSEFYSSLMGIK